MYWDPRCPSVAKGAAMKLFPLWFLPRWGVAELLYQMNKKPSSSYMHTYIQHIHTTYTTKAEHIEPPKRRAQRVSRKSSTAIRQKDQHIESAESRSQRWIGTNGNWLHTKVTLKWTLIRPKSGHELIPKWPKINAKRRFIKKHDRRRRVAQVS